MIVSDRLTNREGAVRPHLDGQPIVIDVLPHARGFYVVVDLLHGRIDGIDGDVIDDGLLVLFGGLIASASADGDLHVDLSALVHRADVLVGIDDLHFGVLRDIGCRDHRGTFLAKTQRLRIVLIGDLGLDGEEL